MRRRRLKGIVDGIRLTEEPLGLIDSHGRAYAQGFDEGMEIARQLGLPDLPCGQERQLVDLADEHFAPLPREQKRNE